MNYRPQGKPSGRHANPIFRLATLVGAVPLFWVLRLFPHLCLPSHDVATAPQNDAVRVMTAWVILVISGKFIPSAVLPLPFVLSRRRGVRLPLAVRGIVRSTTGEGYDVIFFITGTTAACLPRRRARMLPLELA